MKPNDKTYYHEVANTFALILCGLIGTVLAAAFIGFLCLIGYAAFLQLGRVFGVAP